MKLGLTWAQFLWLWNNRNTIAALFEEFNALGLSGPADEVNARGKAADVLRETQRQLDRATERSGN